MFRLSSNSIGSPQSRLMNSASRIIVQRFTPNYSARVVALTRLPARMRLWMNISRARGGREPGVLLMPLT